MVTRRSRRSLVRGDETRAGSDTIAATLLDRVLARVVFDVKRELDEVAHRLAIATGSSSSIAVPRSGPTTTQESAPIRKKRGAARTGLKEATAGFQRRFILAALVEHANRGRWNMAATARALRIDRPLLYRLVERLKLANEEGRS